MDGGLDEVLELEIFFGEGSVHEGKHGRDVKSGEGLIAVGAAEEPAELGIAMLVELLAEEGRGHPRHVDREDQQGHLDMLQATGNSAEGAVIGISRIVEGLDTITGKKRLLFAAGEEHARRIEGLQFVHLVLPEILAVPVEQGLVLLHAGGATTGKEGSGERVRRGGNHEGRRVPALRILARRPPWPLRASSAPGAKAWSIQ